VTMAHTEVTSVPCVRVCGFGGVCSRRSATVSPRRGGAGAREGAGETGETPQTREEQAPCERLCQSGQRHTSQSRRLFPKTPGEGPRQKSFGFSRRIWLVWQKQECGFQQRLTPV
jgi:hypothetical protein